MGIEPKTQSVIENRVTSFHKSTINVLFRIDSGAMFNLKFYATGLSQRLTVVTF